MALKSVVEIDLDDSKFVRFKELFDRYNEALAKTPGVWKAVSKEQQGIATAFERHTAALLAQNQLSKDGDEEDKKRLTRLQSSEKLWISIAHSSTAIAKNVLDIGVGVLKWGSILGAGLLGGSLFGLNRLGGTVGEERRSSMGLGLSIGEQQAFKVNFGRFVNPDSFLSGINNAVSNIANQGPLYALGVNPNQSTEQVALATLQALQKKARSVPVNQLGILESAYGLQDLGIGVEDLRRLREPGAELNQQYAHYRQDVGAFNVNADMAKNWQDFSTQMSRAGETIFKTFVVGLGPLAQPLEHLSAAFVKFLGTAMAPGGILDKGIANVAHWLDNFAGDISAPKFLDAVKSFTSTVGALAQAVDVVARAVGVIKHPIEATLSLAGDTGNAMDNMEWRKRFKDNPNVREYLGLLAETDAQFELPAGLLERQFALESGNNLHPKNSSAGAIGPFQFMPGTARSLGIDPNDPLQAAYGAGQLDAQLMAHYHGDVAKTLAAYNIRGGQGRLDKLIGEHPTDWLLYTPTETQKYVSRGMNAQAPGVVININNNTGGSAVVSASQLGPP